MPKMPGVILIIILFVVSGCEARNESINPPPPVTKQQVGSEEEQNPFPYSFFELDVKYHGIDDKLLVQYRYIDDEIYVSYSDHDENTDQDGEEAFRFLLPRLNALSLTKETSAKQLMTGIFEQFPIREDFRLIEVKVRFNDGEEKVFKRFHVEG